MIAGMLSFFVASALTASRSDGADAASRPKAMAVLRNSVALRLAS